MQINYIHRFIKVRGNVIDVWPGMREFGSCASVLETVLIVNYEMDDVLLSKTVAYTSTSIFCGRRQYDV
jgi:hypothetical protein